MDKIELPVIKKDDNGSKFLKFRSKLEKSPRAAELYIRMCHKIQGKQPFITTGEIATEMSISRSQTFQLLEEFCSFDIIKKFRRGKVGGWFINNDIIDKDAVEIAKKWLK